MNRFTLSLLGFVALLTASCAAQQIPMPFFHAVDTVTAPGATPNFSPTIGYNSLREKDSTMMFHQYSWHEYITKPVGAKGHVWIRNVGPGIFNIGPQDTLFIKGSGVTFTKTGTDTLLMTVAAGSGDITDVGPMYASGAAGTDGVTTFGTTWFTIEGVTNNAFETNLILASADPSADVNITFPSATSTIVGHASSVLDVAGLGLSVSGTTLIFDATELGNLTFGPGTDGSVVYNWNLSAGDPQLTLGNGVFNISSGTLQQGGTAVVLQSRTVSTTSPLAGGGALSGDLTLSITANGIGPTQIDETANYTWTGKHDYTGAEILGASALRFESTTDDNIYTIFAFTDPTSSSKTITFPNASGTVAVSATSPITLSAAGAIGLMQNAGTDVTADLEEETHASEHQDGGADELSVTGLSGLLADVQKVGVRKNSTGTVFTRQQVNFIEGAGISVTVADDAGTPETDVTIAATGASTLWDAIGDPSGDGDVAMANTAQTLTWDTPSTATALDALTLKWNYDATAGSALTRLLVLQRPSTGTGNQTLANFLVLENKDDQLVEAGLVVQSTLTGVINVGVDVSDAEIVTGLVLGDNNVTVGGATISSTEFAILDGNINLASSSEVNGTLPVANAGTGLTTYAQGDMIYATATNTLGKLAKSVTPARYLANSGSSNNPQWDAVNLADGVSGTLGDGNLSSNVTLKGNTLSGTMGSLVASILPTISGAFFNNEVQIGDGTTDTPNLAFIPQTGTEWDLYITDSDDDFNIKSNTGSTENVDIINLGAGQANLTVEGDITEQGSNVPNATNNLSFFSATTSAQLLGVVSDETGSASGTPLAVFNQNPTLNGATLSGDLNVVVIEGANSKTLTESSATSFVRVDVSAGSFVGGTIFYTIYANDGSNYQARSGSINFSIVNESADTETPGLGTVINESIAASAGTLTVSFTTDDTPTDGINIQANAVSSLSQTTLQIKYRVVISSGTATVTGL